MEREQIVKALEYHADTLSPCVKICPYGDRNHCGSAMAKDALALIKELTDENERLSESYDHLEMTKDELLPERSRLICDNQELAKRNERQKHAINVYHIGETKADTVRKMQERLKETFSDRAAYTASHCHEAIDRIADEMMEEET